MLNAASNEFLDQKIVSKSNGMDIYRGTLKHGISKVNIEVYIDKVSKEKKACVF